MHSRRQISLIKTKAQPKTKIKKPLVNKKFTKIVPRLEQNGLIQASPAFLDGGPYAAVEVLNALGIDLIDRPVNYSFMTDPKNSQKKKELKNKNILTKEQITQENSKISANEYFSNSDDAIFVPEIEKRERMKTIQNRSTNDPNKNIKADLSLLVVALAEVSTPEENGGNYVDQDFIKLGKL